MHLKKMALITSLAITTLAVNTLALTGFIYESGPQGSYIAQGDAMISPASGWDFQLGTRIYTDYELMSFSMRLTGTSRRWHIWLDMADGGELVPGFYEATRAPFNDTLGTAGFDWSGNGRGSNTSTSIFEIYEVEYAADSIAVSKIAFDFIQVEETWNTPFDELDLDTRRWSHGSYRLNSNIPFNVPEPTSGLLSMVGVGALLLRRK